MRSRKGSCRPAATNASAFSRSSTQCTATQCVSDVGLDYAPALHPELVLHTDTQTLWRTLESLLRLAERLHLTAAAGGGSAPPDNAGKILARPPPGRTRPPPLPQEAARQ